PWIQSLDAAHVAAILDPTGPVAAHTANYAPVHMLLHAAAWPALGADTTGHHVANVLVHALASALLVALFGRTGVAFAVAGAAGARARAPPARAPAARRGARRRRPRPAHDDPGGVRAAGRRRVGRPRAAARGAAPPAPDAGAVAVRLGARAGAGAGARDAGVR